MSSGKVTLNHTCLEPYYCSLEEVAYSKVACVALALLFLGAGIAVLSQHVILVPRLKFIMGGYLVGLSLFPLLTFAVLHCCKKPEERELTQEIIIPPLSKLYEQIITCQPHRVPNDEHPHFFVHAPIEILQHIYVWAEQDQDLTRSRLSKLCISFFKRFCFTSLELNARGSHLGQLGMGNRTESALQRRSVRNLFAPGVRQIKSIQVVGPKIYVLEDRSFGTRLSAIMVWDMEQGTFTDDLFEVRGEISSFRIDGDNLYFVQMRKGPAELLDYLTAPEITSFGLDFFVPGHYIDDTWMLRVWDIKSRRITKERSLDHYQFGVQVNDLLCITQAHSPYSIHIYNKEDLTPLHTLTGVYDYVLNKNTLFFEGALNANSCPKKYLGQIELDTIPEHKPEEFISLIGNGSAPEPVKVLISEDSKKRITCFALGNEQLFFSEKDRLPQKGDWGKLILISLNDEDQHQTPIRTHLNIDRILSFSHGFVLVGDFLQSNGSTFHFFNLQSKKSWGTIDCSSRVTAFDIFNGDSIVVGFEDGSVRMWSYSPE